MIKEGEVRPEGCIYEPCLDIMPKWWDIRNIADIRSYTKLTS
jgi:hypothetical protein